MASCGVSTRSKEKPAGSSKTPPGKQGATTAAPHGLTTAPPAGQQPMLTLSVFESGIQDLKTTLCGKLDSLKAEVNAISNIVNNPEASIDINSDKLKYHEETELPKL